MVIMAEAKAARKDEYSNNRVKKRTNERTNEKNKGNHIKLLFGISEVLCIIVCSWRQLW